MAALLAAGLIVPGAGGARAQERERISELWTRGSDQTAAVAVQEQIYLAGANGNAYRVVTPEGSVIIDTGLGLQAARQKQLLDAVDDGPVRYVILTHAHADHIGGAPLWRETGAEIIAQRHFRWRHRDQRRLAEFRNRRGRVLWAALLPEAAPPLPEVDVDIIVDDVYAFELGGLRFEVLWTPGAEGPDGISVWIPQLRALFIGDLWGPTPGAFPNLFTLRGENLREAVPFIESLERVMALEPELILAGHFEPVRGKRQIRDLLARTRDAVRHVHDATVAGMNQGKHLLELMHEIRVPEELGISEEYGRVAWGVRAIWEAYTGWFRYDSTTELYAVPAASVYPELAEMAGGADVLVARARSHVSAGRPLQALHLVEIALGAQPGHRAALEARLAALRQLAERVGRRNFQEAGWLGHRIQQTEAALAAPGQVRKIR